MEQTACDSVLQPLNTIHNNVLRALTFSDFKCHITPLYKQLGFLKIKYIYQLELSKLMYTFHNNTLPQSNNSFFQKITETHCHFTRSAANQNYFVPRVGSSLGKRNLTYQGAVTWSSIPQELKISHMVDSPIIIKCFLSHSTIPNKLDYW